MSVEVSGTPQSVYVKNTTTGTPEHDNAKTQIANAIQLQRARYGSKLSNSRLASHQVVAHIPLNYDCQAFLTNASKQLGLSARAYFKVIKLARTIADLDQCPNVAVEHLAEALQYRPQAQQG